MCFNLKMPSSEPIYDEMLPTHYETQNSKCIPPPLPLRSKYESVYCRHRI